jgi:hypothetical protein
VPKSVTVLKKSRVKKIVISGFVPRTLPKIIPHSLQCKSNLSVKGMSVYITPRDWYSYIFLFIFQNFL